MCLAATVAALGAEAGDMIEGRPVVVDAETIVVGGHSIRFWGIEAPLGDTSEARQASAYLRTLIADNTVRCEDTGDRVQNRIVGKCFIGTVDLGHVMVLSGHARDRTEVFGGYHAPETRP